MKLREENKLGSIQNYITVRKINDMIVLELFNKTLQLKENGCSEKVLARVLRCVASFAFSLADDMMNVETQSLLCVCELTQTRPTSTQFLAPRVHGSQMGARYRCAPFVTACVKRLYSDRVCGTSSSDRMRGPSTVFILCSTSTSDRVHCFTTGELEHGLSALRRDRYAFTSPTKYSERNVVTFQRTETIRCS